MWMQGLLPMRYCILTAGTLLEYIDQHLWWTERGTHRPQFGQFLLSFHKCIPWFSLLLFELYSTDQAVQQTWQRVGTTHLPLSCSYNDHLLFMYVKTLCIASVYFDVWVECGLKGKKFSFLRFLFPVHVCIFTKECWTRTEHCHMKKRR